MSYDFSQLVDDFKLSTNNPLIKDAVKQPFEKMWIEQSLPFSGPEAHDKFCTHLHHLIDKCNDRKILKAYCVVLRTHELIIDYINKHF
jgi:hypothetical protein